MKRQQTIKVVFPYFADARNPNSQSLSAREIGLRLDPRAFKATFFVLGDPDPRLLDQSHIDLRQLPARGGSLLMAAELLWGAHDLIYSPTGSRAARLFWRFRVLGRRSLVLSSVEATAEQIQAAGERLQSQAIENLRSADACYAVSPAVAETVRRAYGLDLPVIPLGVNLNVFQARDRQQRFGPCRILFVGTLQARKQPHLLLELAGRLKELEAEFHLIGPPHGDPAYYGELLLQRERDGLSQVHFHGSLNQREIARWMADSDLFVLPSRLEGLPKVTLEAAASGLPCIVFDDYQTPSVVDGVTGFQVHELEEMEQRLELLIENRDLRLEMGAAAAAHAKQYDWDIVAKQWEQAFLELLDAHP